LNSHSRSILQKYEPFEFKDGKALPVASNQKMNQYLHELCEMAGFDEPIRITPDTINYLQDIHCLGRGYRHSTQEGHGAGDGNGLKFSM